MNLFHSLNKRNGIKQLFNKAGIYGSWQGQVIYKYNSY